MDLDSIESSNAYMDLTEKNCQIHLNALNKNIVTHCVNEQRNESKSSNLAICCCNKHGFKSLSYSTDMMIVFSENIMVPFFKAGCLLNPLTPKI